MPLWVPAHTYMHTVMRKRKRARAHTHTHTHTHTHVKIIKYLKFKKSPIITPKATLRPLQLLVLSSAYVFNFYRNFVIMSYCNCI